jgi:hypothetical protein
MCAGIRVRHCRRKKLGPDGTALNGHRRSSDCLPNCPEPKQPKSCSNHLIDHCRIVSQSLSLVETQYGRTSFTGDVAAAVMA